MNKRHIVIVVLVMAFATIVAVCWMLTREQVASPAVEQPEKNEAVPAKVATLPEIGKTVPVSSIHPAVASIPPPAQIDNTTQFVGLALSPGVKTIVGLDKEHGGHKDRRAALQKLTRHLSAGDVEGLRILLDTKLGSQKDMDMMTFNALKNDVLDVLLRQDRVPEMGPDLINMFRDKVHDDVWRDYCLQYIGLYYDRRWPAGAQIGGDAESTNVVAAYSEALAAKDKTFAGTALLGIERLSRTRPDINRTNISDTAVALATDETCIEANRITAFRVAASMHRPEVLPSARITAQTGATGPLRMAAIATIGDLGDTTDRELLQSFAASPEKRISTIAQSALKRLEARQVAATGQK